MAKIGETDSRWIVAHRTDGKNVDNWHWNERDLMPWSKGRFETVLSNLNVPTSNSDITSLKIDKVESVSGTNIVCNRKAKTFFVFDITLKLKWSGKIKVDGAEVDGGGIIFVDDISNTEDKWKTVVKMDDETAKNRALKLEMQNKIGSIIDKPIDDVLEEMKKHNAPTEEVGEPRVISAAVPVRVSTKSAGSPATATKVDSPGAKTLNQKVTFEIGPQMLYDTFLDSNRMSALSGGPAKVENRVGGEFVLFDGVVRGTQVELVPPKKIIQNWRFQSWPDNHYSQVTLQFDSQSGDKTVLTLTQTAIPSNDFERTRAGWDSYFWQRIRGLFGWNYKIHH